MKFTTKGVVALAAALALGLTAACQPGGGTGGSGETPPPSISNTELAQSDAQFNEQPRENIKDGGTLTTAITEITPQFNTFQADGTRYTLDVWKWNNPIMALYTASGEWSFNDDYLTDVSVEQKDGDTVVTYTIREDATFNDGTPIDWKAFETTWKVSSGKDEEFLVSSTDGYDRITSVVAGENDKQAVVTWGGGWAWWQGQFNYVLHPKAGVDAKTFNEAYLNNPHPEWGAGPYTVKNYDQQGGTITFERNPKWWGDPGKLDERTFRVMESQASLNAFKNGEIDATSVATKDRLSQVQGMADVEVRQSATPSNSLMVINSESEILADPKVRQAIMQGVDRETILKVQYDGLNYTEELPGSFTLFPWQEGYKDNLAEAGVTYDAEAAKALLEEAGWTVGDDGFRAKDGKVLEITLPVLGDSPTTKARATALQAMMKEIGVKLNNESRPSSDFSTVFNGKLFDIFLMGFASSDPFGQAYFCQLYCSNSSLNVSGTGTAELDAKIEEAAGIPDPDEQTAELNKLEVEALATYGILPIFNGPTMIAVKAGLANYGAELFHIGKPQDIGWQK
ncbi:ABC transporter family substrate-binding protein [Propionibacteriaceae bacterium Y2011]|uniref:ABC transporter family substrate-binding protein n=1 Tax=Microlunatus sp. Y2014 TaxID=3418488 RepID=UPI003B4EC1E4